MGRAVSENKIAAYTMPLGVYGQLMAAIGGKRPGILTHVGLHTYADPRQEGCKINDRAKEQGREIVELVKVDGKDYLFYKAFHIDACILHASYADELGNISLQDEPIRGELLELAAAVHNNGGTVIVEVKNIVKAGSLDPRQVLIHKSYVDYLVKTEKEDNIALAYSPSLIGDIRVPTEGSVKPLALSYKKVITRRAVMELQKGSLVNLGIGIPAGVANVANEEGTQRAGDAVSGDWHLWRRTSGRSPVRRLCEPRLHYPLIRYVHYLRRRRPGYDRAGRCGDRPLRQRERVQVLRPLRGSRRLYQHLPEHAEGLLRFLLHLR